MTGWMLRPQRARIRHGALLQKVLLIGFAGALGAMLRYGVQTWVNSAAGGPTVLGTFLVNVSGAFLLGLLIALTEERFLTSGPWRQVLAVGFLGAFTTFSTLVYEVTARTENGNLEAAILNLGSSVLFGLLAVYGGLLLGRAAT